MRPCLPLLFVLGCVPMNPSESNEDSNGAAPTTDDLIADLGLEAEEACDGHEDSTGQYHEIPGSTRYWVGEFTFDEDGDGQAWERLVLLPNDTFKQTNDAEDCVVAWFGDIEKTDPHECGSCDYRLVGSLAMDNPSTDCIDDYVDHEPDTLEVDYNVVVHGDGTASMYWRSGNQAPFHAEADESELTYVSDYACEFY